jgi:hypothetical protein
VFIKPATSFVTSLVIEINCDKINMYKFACRLDDKIADSAADLQRHLVAVPENLLPIDGSFQLLMANKVWGSYLYHSLHRLNPLRRMGIFVLGAVIAAGNCFAK